MAEVSTTINGKVYTYKYNGKFYTWFDGKNLPVPLILHSRLREQVISEGKDESIFLSQPKPPRHEDLSEPEDISFKENKSQKKKSSNLFNPFLK
jgi:hypothetical protein